MQFKGMHEAHRSEVMALYFFDSQEQMLSMTVQGEVALWDALKMQIVQVLRNHSQMEVSKLGSSFFHAGSGRLILATSQVFEFSAQEEEAARIKIDH